MSMRVLVCGGRNYDDWIKIYSTLDHINHEQEISCIIHGYMKGADVIARNWALSRGIRNDPYPAKWDKYGKSAGPIRNQQMIDEGKPDLIVAFPGGRGTANMIKLAKEAGIEVMEVKP